MRVVEVGAGFIGGLAGLVLEQLGASVTRIERIGGDWLSTIPPLRDGRGVLSPVVNRNKTILQLDLTSEDGHVELHSLLAAADIAVLGFSKPERARLRIDVESMLESNPGLILCEVTGWGRSGPLADQPATELDIQAATGMMLSIGRQGDPPSRQGYDIVSVNTALVAAQAVLAALLARRRGEVGQVVQVSMLQSAVALSQFNITPETGVAYGPAASIDSHAEAYHSEPDHGYACADGRFYFTFRGDESAWTEFFIELDRMDLLSDSSFNSVEELRVHERLLRPILEPTLQSYSYDALEQLIRFRLGGAMVPILELSKARGHPQVSALGFLGGEDVPDLGLPIRIVT
jgi:crotonobetainyl-CoA:carnitine CoA-transferase CaiB-like acyl-CoA transferase